MAPNVPENDQPDKAIEAQRYFDLVRDLHGDGLTEAQLSIVRERVDDVVNAGEMMRTVTLDNAEEPFSVFTPYDPGAAR
jgi:hypothetical protein